MAVTLNRSFCFSTVCESNFANTWCDVSKYFAASFSKLCQFAHLLSKQEAQLLQIERPRDASCHWIFCLVTRGHSKWHCWVGCVLVSISISLKLSVCRTVSEMFNVKKCRVFETGGWGRSRSLKMEPIDRSNDLYRFWVMWRWIILSPWNLG